MGMIINPYLVQPSGDADALSFITAAGITDNTQKSAIETLVTDLKGYGIWTKMKAIYPFVGGTASSHKFNLKDSRDLDAAYRLTFSGGWTHSSNGAEANGSNGYADTKLNPVTSLSLYNAHSSVYQRKTTLNSGFDIGNTVNGVYNKEFLLTSYRGGQAISAFYDYGNVGYIAVNVASAAGFTQNSITSNTSSKLYKNASVIGLNTNVNTTEPNNCNIYIGGVNSPPSMVEPHDGQYAFASIGDGLTDAEAANFYTAVQAFQTTLGRQV